MSGQPGTSAPVCVSCGAARPGRYCPECGELDPRERPVTLGAFLAESFEAITDLDGRTVRSFTTLVRRPGRMVRDYLAGRRRPYLPPLQLFLLANVLFFLAVPFTGTEVFSNPLENHMYRQAHSGLAAGAVAKRGLVPGTETFRVFEARFDQASEVQASTLVGILIPLFAVFLYGTRFWKREPALVHVVLSTHYIAVLLLAILAIGVAGGILAQIPPVGRVLRGDERPVLVLLIVLLGVYLYAALRNAYGDGRIAAGVRAALLGVGTILLMVVYQMILFFTVFYTI